MKLQPTPINAALACPLCLRCIAPHRITQTYSKVAVQIGPERGPSGHGANQRPAFSLRFARPSSAISRIRAFDALRPS